MDRDDLGRRAVRAATLALVLATGGCALTRVDWLAGGETLMAQYRTPAHEIDYKAAGLEPPPMGLRWYRVDKNYVLANRTTGLIIKDVPIPAAP